MRDTSDFKKRFQEWKNGKNYWESRGIDLGSNFKKPASKEQLDEIRAKLKKFDGGKDSNTSLPHKTYKIINGVVYDGYKLAAVGTKFKRKDGKTYITIPGGFEEYKGQEPTYNLNRDTIKQGSNNPFRRPVERAMDVLSGRRVPSGWATYGTAFSLGLGPVVAAASKLAPAGASAGEIGSALNTVFNATNPSSYLGRGAYSTIMGGTGRSAVGAVADAALASVGAAEALNQAADNISFKNVTNATLASLPFTSITSKTPMFRKAMKAYERYRTGDLYDYRLSDFFDAASNIALKEGNVVKKPNKTEKENFLKRYRKLAAQYIPPYNIPYVDKTAVKILNDNPEYFLYLRDRGIFPEYATKLSYDDLINQELVQDFLNKQYTSIRGVRAKNEEDAVRFLTTTESGRVSEGDRLNTRGGLYTSNIAEVADRFKNPHVGTEDGYIGTLMFDRPTEGLSLEQQLANYRKHIYPVQRSNPLSGTHAGLVDLQRAIDEGAIAFEDVYVGNASRGRAGNERAYLPHGESGNVETPVRLIELKRYPNQTNQNGRWANDLSDIEKPENVFYSRQLNSTSDFIPMARSFLKGYPSFDERRMNTAYDRARNTYKRQIDKRIQLFNKNNVVVGDLMDLFGIGAVSAGSGLGLYGTYEGLNYLGRERRKGRNNYENTRISKKKTTKTE